MKTTAENIWRTQALSYFNEEDILLAKSSLWSTCDNCIIGDFIPHRGNTKNKLHFEDILKALKKLSEANSLPIFLASSAGIRDTPIFNVDCQSNSIAEVINRIKVLEDSMSDFIKNQSEVLDNFISKQNAIVSTPKDQINSDITVPKSYNPNISDTNAINISAPDSFPPLNLDNGASHDSNSFGQLYTAFQPNSYFPSNSYGLQHENGSFNMRNMTYAHSVGLNNSSNGSVPMGNINRGQTPEFRATSVQSNNSWKRKSNITYGSAKTSNLSYSLSADVELAVFGVAKHASEKDLVDFITQKGINVIKCELLTRYKEARTNTFKVVILASDYEKAILPETWPFRVGVRLFRRYQNKPQDNRINKDNTSNQVNNFSKGSAPMNSLSSINRRHQIPDIRGTSFLNQRFNYSDSTIPTSNQFNLLSDSSQMSFNNT